MGYRYDERERLFTGHSGRVFLTLTLTLVCLKLIQRLLPPLLPAIIDDLAISAFLAGFALTVLQLSRAAIQYPGGRLSDQLSRTTVLIAALCVAIVATAALSLAVTYGMLLVGLTLFGLSLALYIPPSRALLSDIFHEKRGRAFGLHTMGSDLAGVIAAGIAVYIVTVATWRAAFFPILLLFIPLPLVFYFLSREPIRLKPIDLGLRETSRRLVRDRSMMWLIVVYSLFSIGSSGVIGFLPAFLIDVHGVSFAIASSVFAMVYGVGLIMRPLSGAISDVIPRPVVAGGSLLLAGAGVTTLVVAPVSAVMIGGVGIYAIGQQSLAPALQAYLMDRIPDGHMGGDFGAMRTIHMSIGSLGPSFTGFIVGTLGFVTAYLSLLVFFLAGALILLWFTLTGWSTDG